MDNMPSLEKVPRCPLIPVSQRAHWSLAGLRHLCRINNDEKASATDSSLPLISCFGVLILIVPSCDITLRLLPTNATHG